jgi:threonine aldolase
VQTNLIFFHVHPDVGTAKDVAAQLKAHGILVLPTAAQTIRACTHLDVSAAQATQAAEAIREVVRGR